MERDAFLNTLAHKLHEVNTEQEQKRANASARLARLEEIDGIIRQYDQCFASNGVKTSLANIGQSQKALSWRLSFADSTEMVLSVNDNDEKEELELELSFTKSGQPAVYIPLPFVHTNDGAQHIEARAATMRLDHQWSPETFETFVQDLITAFLDDAPRHGGTSLLTPHG